MRAYLAMDVGGTELKSCLLGEKGERITEILRSPSKSKETKTVILENFTGIIGEMVKGEPLLPGYRKEEVKIAGMAFAFPGEFDYENGICLIHGLDKYEAIYGVNLKEVFREAALRMEWENYFECPKSMPVLFVNDVTAFALGGGKGRRAMALVIGTGAGSAFVDGGELAPKGRNGVPESGMIYREPFHGKRMDDWLSKRGLMALSGRITGKPMEGYELAELVRKGDAGAVKVYREFGKLLAEGAGPFLKAFAPKVCILGGQIMKSFALFGQELAALCDAEHIALEVIEKTSETTFEGLYQVLKRQEEGAWKNGNESV